MLKQRLLTAIILIPIFIFLLFKLTAAAFAVLTAGLVFWCGWEWSFLIGIKKFPHCLIYPVLLMALMAGALFLPVPEVLIATFFWWLLATILVLLYPRAQAVWSRYIWVRALMGVFVLIPCWMAINFLRNVSGDSPSVLLFLFMMIWGADSGAYFVGKQWGKTKLAPLVSPGKSWQGFFGALIITILIAVLALWWSVTPYDLWPKIIALCLCTVIFSILGDLFESMLKRQAGRKDSGNLLPGHGGILDRIDSLTAAAPIFALGIILLGKISH
jgi:phosphatidate cytidylyltransferase